MEKPPTTAVAFSDEDLRKLAQHMAYILRPMLEERLREMLLEMAAQACLPSPGKSKQALQSSPAFLPPRQHPVHEGPACVLPRA